MSTLSFVGLSDDGSALVLSGSDGGRYTVTIDERLRSAARGSKTAELDTPDHPIGAKEIQARMRAGATPQEVADVSGWSVERVTAFSAPVLQERSWIAEKAQTCPVGRGDEDPQLGVRVVERLAERGVDTDNVRWDAWLRENGSWTVLLAYPAGQGDRVATWSFDPNARMLKPQDDEAVWLSGDSSSDNSRPRLVHMPSHEAPDTPPPTENQPTSAFDRRPLESLNHPAGRGPRSSGQSPSHDEPASKTVVSDQKPSRATDSEAPSWDEVLFGGPTDSPRR